MKRGLFISVEGTDGSGKTTQIELMEKYLRTKGYDIVLTREPGGTNIGERIRSILLDTSSAEMTYTAEMLLYAAARAQLVSQVIKPSLKAGKIVICDRFIDSSYAYQGFGRGLDMEEIAQVNRSAIDGIMPDITFFFDISPGDALARRMASAEADRIEKEKLDFHMRVYSGYKKLALLYPERIKPIDSNRSIEEVHKEVCGYLDQITQGGAF